MRPDGSERVVLVHDWLTGMRGGEKCLEPACRRWPDARLFTLLHRPGSVSEPIERLDPRASLLNRLPGVDRYYRYLLPLMPLAARWPIPDCDLVAELQPLRRQGRRPAAGRAARLLLLHPDAVRLAHAGGVLPPRPVRPDRRPRRSTCCWPGSATGTGGPPTA